MEKTEGFSFLKQARRFFLWMLMIIFAAAGLLIADFFRNAPEPADADFCWKVVRIVDGDTFVAENRGKEERIRMIGIDTPESVHPNPQKNSRAGKRAAKYTRRLLKNQFVRLELDVEERDRYGRLLAYVFLEDGTFVNEKLVEEGYAVIYTKPPNVKYEESLLEAFRRRKKQERSVFESDRAGLFAQKSGRSCLSGEAKKQEDRHAEAPRSPNSCLARASRRAFEIKNRNPACETA